MHNRPEGPYVHAPSVNLSSLHVPRQEAEELRGLIQGGAAVGVQRCARPPFRDTEVGDLDPKRGERRNQDVLGLSTEKSRLG